MLLLYKSYYLNLVTFAVAPPVGAWIEISFFAQDTPPDGVAPLAEGELKKVNLELLVSSNALM